jgi:protein-S-isoprenylcysteine O-methyltransferase Ste14
VKRASAASRASPLDVSPRERALAVALGVACHASFLLGVAAMAASLHEGLRFGRGVLHGAAALAFACALWTGPWMTTDRLLLACLWTVYCLVGPLHKESRFLAREPGRYGRYRELVPYWLPRIAPRHLEL